MAYDGLYAVWWEKFGKDVASLHERGLLALAFEAGIQEVLKNGHYCSGGGKIRPYPEVVCSNCPSVR